MSKRKVKGRFST